MYINKSQRIFAYTFFLPLIRIYGFLFSDFISLSIIVVLL